MSYKRPQMESKCVVCGSAFTADRCRILSGRSKVCSLSCRGKFCSSNQIKLGRAPTHGGTARGKSAIYKRWAGIKARCYQVNTPRYENYGARGIKMCEEWRTSFEAFRDWALSNGFDPSLEIDRIDNSKGYSPENCRWVTCAENQNNRTNTIRFQDGRTIRDVATATGLSMKCIRQRVYRGMSLDEILNTPPMTKGRVAKPGPSHPFKP